ncbi:MAG TPA: fumarylacetoacetate hydrolase family protein, partial [Nocardioidaceae bacterium]|nr:fumarylacetoacetate hydrolase family protein [Nocardioidaceae bacterium]
MRLLRVGEVGRERPCVFREDGTVVDVSSLVDDYDGAFLAGGGVDRLRDALTGAADLPEVDLAEERVGPCVARPPKVVCIGLNYHDHARETGAEPPTEPVIFFKAADTVVGPHDTVLVPRGSVKTDWEVELAVVIGRTARYVESAEAALGHVAGYAVAHDVSEREFQIERGGTWDKGKNCETFNPLGPWLVTADEVAD